MTRPSTWPVLALLRFALAAVVVSTHFYWFVPPGHPLRALVPLNAFAAVLGFLFVSGYSIAHSLRRRPDGFYVRRLVRIYPAYALAIVASLVPFWVARQSVIVCPLQDFKRPGLANVLINAVFGQTWVGGPLSSNAVVWTLAVEVACYAAAPLLLRLRTRTVLALLAVSATAFAVYPHLHWFHYSLLKFGLPLLFLAWAWLAGFVYYALRDSVAATAMFIGGSALLVGLNVTDFPLGVATTAVSAAVLAVAPFVRLPGWCHRPMEWLGDLSYPLYLLHLPGIQLAWVLGVRNPYLWLAAAVACGGLALILDGLLHVVIRRARRPQFVPTAT